MSCQASSDRRRHDKRSLRIPTPKEESGYRSSSGAPGPRSSCLSAERSRSQEPPPKSHPLLSAQRKSTADPPAPTSPARGDVAPGSTGRWSAKDRGAPSRLLHRYSDQSACRPSFAAREENSAPGPEEARARPLPTPSGRVKRQRKAQAGSKSGSEAVQ